MTRGLWKKGTAVTLVTAMGIGLCACGGKTTTGSNEAMHYFKTTYLSDLPSTFNANMGNNISFKGDTMYYGSYNEEYTEYGLYSYNLITKEEATLYSIVNSNEENSNVSSFAVGEDGSVYLYLSKSVIDESSLTEDYSNATRDDVIAYMVDEWGYNEETATEDWDSYYTEQYTDDDGNVDYGAFMKSMKASYINTYSLKKVDASGNEIYDQDISAELGENSSCNGIALDSKGNMYISINTWSDTNDQYFVEIVDADGNIKGKIQVSGYTSSLVTLADGTVASIGWGDSGTQLTVLDAAAMSEGKKISVPSETMSVLDENTLLITDGSTVYKYNMNDESKEKYFSWMDCNISSSTVSSYGVLSDGSIAVYTQNWNSSGNQSEVALMTEVDESEITQTTEINVACLWMDSAMEEKAIKFNKSQDQYHINITQYYDDTMEYEDALKAYTTAISSDPNIDIVVFNNYSDVLDFAAKGLTTDLYPLIENDAELSKDTFMPNVLSACEYDGKLVALPLTFSLETLVGKTEDVGTESGWTLEDMQNVLASKPEGTQLMNGTTRASALSMCLNLGYDQFIDWENTTCNFNSEEFINVLEFANMFPEEFDWENSEDETVLMNTGKVLLSSYYLYDFNQIQMYTEIFGGELTYIGYPTTQGNGAMMSLTNLMGINESSDNKEGAWQFLREMYLPKDEESTNYYGGFSVRKDEFEAFCTNAMKKDDMNSGTWGWGEFQIEIQPATQEQVDTVKDLVYNTTAVDGAISSDIMNIITEETAAYFSGQKSAESVADVIQSRMQVYLSETK